MRPVIPYRSFFCNSPAPAGCLQLLLSYSGSGVDNALLVAGGDYVSS